MRKECRICGEPIRWWQQYVHREDIALGAHKRCVFFYVVQAIADGLLPIGVEGVTCPVCGKDSSKPSPLCSAHFTKGMPAEAASAPLLSYCTCCAEPGYRHLESCSLYGTKAPVVQPEAQVIERVRKVVRNASEFWTAFYKAYGRDSNDGHFLRTVTDVTALVTRECNAARLAGLRQGHDGFKHDSRASICHTCDEIQELDERLRALAAKEQP